ncbi:MULTISPECIES: right-handed parallel beta-helix repeat-containing protein [Streptococcus]|uniref:Right-handed parallel beta-helix repeat-containing protein n=1 Tax=Streptococcus caledonicus TaxID=2614158 RepID=A0ABW0UDG8_9STRE|nr:right-handed parallel beta-helix repeat-containing protein [Streptococcus sp. S784/96/1]
MKYYVNQQAPRSGQGTKEYPFKSIQEAANLAKPGDEVLVYPGVYRENVNPVNGGTADARITYTSVEKEAAIITGAESVKTWEPYDGNVWVARISNGLFGDFNPYVERVYGDWFVQTILAHLGDVFLNDKSLYEVETLDDVLSPVIKLESWDSDFSIYTWYTEQDETADETIIYANFQGLNPNEENVEISVRKNCFYPVEEGRGYITVSGFTICKAAVQWAPPTALQEGMIGPHWSKGWIIEDCDIYEAKCSGISLGKYYQPENDNKWSKWKYKDGTQTEREVILQAQREGWTKERIGSHIIRRNNIHDCGQTGIVGHLGCVFSIIEDNHIHHINNKQNLAGAEIGGIKLHAAIDAQIRRNHIHHCSRGLWLDWQAQGTRVSQNLFHDNTIPKEFKGDRVALSVSVVVGEDVFLEVSHGPTLLDNNLFLSERSVKMATQGVALVHNIVAGGFVAVGVGTNNGAKGISSPRYTPYHVPHQTEVAGFMTFLHGDDRFYNNIFIQQDLRPEMVEIMKKSKAEKNDWDDNNVETGTFPFDSYPTFEEWDKEFEGYCGMGSAPSDRYYNPLPVWTGGNIFMNGAKPSTKEVNYAENTTDKVSISVVEKADGWYLETNLYDVLPELKTGIISTETLGMAFEPEQKFENPDGSPIVFDTDYFDNRHSLVPLAGPFVDKFSGLQKLISKIN